MTRRISLALTLHNHQPVGNFGWVFAEVFERAYEPMVAAIERHPGIRLGLHYTGPLLEWLQAEEPAFIIKGRVPANGLGLPRMPFMSRYCPWKSKSSLSDQIILMTSIHSCAYS